MICVVRVHAVLYTVAQSAQCTQKPQATRENMPLYLHLFFQVAVHWAPSHCISCTTSIRTVLYLHVNISSQLLVNILTVKYCFFCKSPWDHIWICYHGFIVWRLFVLSCCTFFSHLFYFVYFYMCGFSMGFGWRWISTALYYCIDVFDVYTVWPRGSLLTRQWRLNTLWLYCNCLSLM